jgi:tetratricopeptide (TPR) repeat protein
MENEPKIIEAQAYQLLAQEKFSEAFNFYRQAAQLYQKQHQHKQAALCFAAAASCWSKKSGEKRFYAAATSYQEAACQAQLAQDYEYAASLYKYAAMNYERDMDLLNFSECFYLAKEMLRKFFAKSILSPRKFHAKGEKVNLENLLKHILLWAGLTFSFFIWGHGERPVRTFFAALAIILLSAIFYSQGTLVQGGLNFRPDIFQGLYFSIVTFTTVGFGDITALGINRVVVVLEALSAIFIMPLFMIALSRKYLRI